MSEMANRPGGPAGSGSANCLPGAHAGVPTAVDERARRLSHEELAVANLLAGEGHRVVALAEQGGGGPVADLEVCGQPVEVKSFLALPERAGRAPGGRSVCNKLLSARTQASTAVVYGPASGLTEKTAREGVAEFAGRGRVGRIREVRVVGDGFDLSWSLRLDRQAGIIAVPAPPSERAVAPSERAVPPGDAPGDAGRLGRRHQPPRPELGR